MEQREFYLLRKEDVNGKSGTGVVARGVVLPSGRAVLEWQTFHSSINIYNNLDSIEEIHGHGGATVVIMGAPPDIDSPKKKKKKPSK